MTRIYRPATTLDDWRLGLADPDKQWRAGYSAMATAQIWQAAKGAEPPEIARLFDPEPELLLAIPEHKVPLPGGLDLTLGWASGDPAYLTDLTGGLPWTG